ncbi:helix-turn-helix domain-containing protein [Bacillus subtilis]|uniref:helix-turn-helix domain-containing protein n=1 Tax=Bacillus subtilis TaxID=1423 RepID=UPI000FFDFB98|nr:helix-turn-helix domain-containing protein [Bacillus subtilis]QAT44334.1 helix-turn-helix domain-containing protein [Bacillus subtilis]
MSFINLKSLVKKVNMKPKGITEIVLEVSTKELGGSRISRLSEMIDKEVQAQLESETVQYVLEINAKTEKPITNYTFDQRGIVNVADPEPEQLEAELGLPEEKPRIEEKPMEIDREIVDSFITEGTPPVRDGFPENIDEIAKRCIEGESYRKLANELNMSSGAIVDLINKYRKEVAPLAEAWWDWKQDQAAEAEPMEEEKPSVPLDESSEYDLPSNDEKEEDNQDEGEHGAA